MIRRTLSRPASVVAWSREFFSLRATRTRTLRANFSWNAVGSGVFALGQWGVLIIFAKLGSAELVGRAVYGLAIAAPLFVFANLQLRSIQATDADDKHALGHYFGLRTLTTLAATAIAVLVTAIAWNFDKQLALLILLWALSKTVDSFSDVLYGFFQQSERMDYVGLSLALRGFFAVACVAILFRATHSAAVALAGLVVAWGTVLILFDLPSARRLHGQLGTSFLAKAIAPGFRPVISVRRLAPLFLESLPLGIVALLLTLQVQIPRYVVGGVLHSRALGLFSAAAYLTFTGSILVNSLGAPACVRLAKYYVWGDRAAFRRLMIQLLLIASALGALGILVSALFGRQILTLLYTEEYSEVAGVLVVLCAAGAISYLSSFLGYGMTALRRFKVQVPIFVCVAGITVVSCYFLTLHFGLMGTAVGIFLGNLGQLIMSAVVVWRTRPYRRSAAPCDSAVLEAGSSRL